MEHFLDKHAAKLKAIALILMLVIPFLLYAAVVQGPPTLVNLLLGLFILNMVFIMKKG